MGRWGTWGACGCCSTAICGQIRVPVNGCNGKAESGVSVSATLGGSVVGTAVTGTTVAGVTVTAQGSGYTATFQVTFGANSGGAFGNATVSAGKVTGVTMIYGGTGITGAIAPDFSAGSGTGAVGTATQASNACIPISATGSYTIAVTPPASAQWDQTTITQTVTVTNCATGGATTTISLTAGTGYTCKCTVCTDALPASWFATDANGTVALNATSAGGWANCYTDGSGNLVSYWLRCPGTSGTTLNKYSIQQIWGPATTTTCNDGLGTGVSVQSVTVIDGTTVAPNNCPFTSKTYNFTGALISSVIIHV